MIEDDITRALQQAAIAARNVVSNSIDHPIQGLGITLDPKPTKFIELVQIRNNDNGRYWGDERLYQGTFRLLFHWPNDSQGDYAPIAFVQSVAAYFTKAKRLVSGNASVEIYEEPNLSDPIENGQERLFPLSLSYRCFAP